jgi:hypothetical protein
MSKPADSESGGVGGIPDDAALRAQRWEQRQHLRALEQAVYNGWKIPEEAATVLPREVYAIASDPNASPRDRIRATELIAALRKADIEACIDLDRINRLDAGTATDRVEVVHEMPDSALSAVARALQPQQPACPAKPKRRR